MTVERWGQAQCATNHETLDREFLHALQECGQSPSLRIRQERLAWLIDKFLQVLNEEVGPLGKGAAREIKKLMKLRCHQGADNAVPISFEDDGHSFMTMIRLGDAPSGEEEACQLEIIGDTPWVNKWYSPWDSSDFESFLNETRELDRFQVETAAQRLARVVTVLDVVFHDPESQLHKWAETIRSAHPAKET